MPGVVSEPRRSSSCGRRPRLPGSLHPAIPVRCASKLRPPANKGGGKEAFYALAQCAGGASPDYDVIAMTRTETFEKELNELAAKGLRLIPAALVSIEKRVLMMKAHNIETVGVVERVVEATPLVYRVLSTLRLGTLEQELQAVAAEGFRLVAFATGPKEWIAVLAK